MLRVVQVVRQQRCNGHCLSDCSAQQLKEQLRSAQVAGQWRGDTALTLPLFWRRSTVSSVFFGRFPRSSLSLCRPLPIPSPSLIGHLASVDGKQHERKELKFEAEKRKKKKRKKKKRKKKRHFISINIDKATLRNLFGFTLILSVRLTGLGVQCQISVFI